MAFRRLVRSLNHPLRSPPPPLLSLRRNNKSGGDTMRTCKTCGFRDTKHNVYRHRALHDAGLLNQNGHPTMLLDPDLRSFYDTKLTIMPKQSELHKEYDYPAKKYEGQMVRIFTFKSGKWSKVVHARISLQCLEGSLVFKVYWTDLNEVGPVAFHSVSISSDYKKLNRRFILLKDDSGTAGIAFQAEHRCSQMWNQIQASLALLHIKSGEDEGEGEGEGEGEEEEEEEEEGEGEEDEGEEGEGEFEELQPLPQYELQSRWK